MTTEAITPLRQRMIEDMNSRKLCALAQRGHGFRTHRQLLSWMRLTTPRSSRQGTPPAIDDLYFGYRARRQPPASAGYRAAI